MKILYRGFNYSQDGPGNRLIYHLQGCNFACKWCSNADTIPLENPKATDVEIKDIVDEVKRSKMMFFDGGGVTFTGGECMLQFSELIPLLKKLKENGINTCIETNGSVPKLLDALQYIDYLIVDFKHYDSEQHKLWTGMSNDVVKSNIEKIINSKRQVHIRIPVINHVNNSNPDKFASYFSKFDCSNAVFEFLSYHEFGKEKWNGKYEITDGFVSKEDISGFYTAFAEHGLKTVKT